jgi:hypothetical protein
LLYFVEVFMIAYRDKKVVGVFVRFSCITSHSTWKSLKCIIFACTLSVCMKILWVSPTIVRTRLKICIQFVLNDCLPLATQREPNCVRLKCVRIQIE